MESPDLYDLTRGDPIRNRTDVERTEAAVRWWYDTQQPDYRPRMLIGQSMMGFEGVFATEDYAVGDIVSIYQSPSPPTFHGGYTEETWDSAQSEGAAYEFYAGRRVDEATHDGEYRLDPGRFVQWARRIGQPLDGSVLYMAALFNSACKDNANLLPEPVWLPDRVNRETMDSMREVFHLGPVADELLMSDVSRVLMIVGRPIKRGDEMLAFYGDELLEKDECRCFKVNPDYPERCVVGAAQKEKKDRGGLESSDDDRTFEGIQRDKE